jgi:ATP-binding cassette subfamily B protein
VILASSLPLYAVVLAITNFSNRRVLRNAMERMADFESQLVESISAIQTIKRFGLEDEAYRRAESRLVRLLRPVFRAGATGIFSSQTTELTSRLVVILLFWVGAGLVLRNEMSPGELLGFYALVGYLTAPMTQLIGANRAVQDALISGERLFEIMDLERERTTSGSLSALPPGPVRFVDVHFRYGRRKPAIQALDLTIQRGRTTAIVGPSGSGKSTVAALLQRLYPIDRGRISIGEVDLHHLEITAIRRWIAVVPQDLPLFSGSVAENIALGDSSPDLDRIVSICREIELFSVIDALPSGFATTLGSSGADLSAGQRQKIAIARAIYRDPEILILDEASSNLDALGEIAVQRCLHRLELAGKTIIVIAHRLATAARGHRIVVLDEGRVSEEGSHADLLAAGGLYSRLWVGQNSPSHFGELVQEDRSFAAAR